MLKIHLFSIYDYLNVKESLSFCLSHWNYGKVVKRCRKLSPFFLHRVSELRQKFPRHVFHVDHLLNEESGGPWVNGMEDLKDRGERCIVYPYVSAFLQPVVFSFRRSYSFFFNTYTFFSSTFIEQSHSLRGLFLKRQFVSQAP